MNKKTAKIRVSDGRPSYKGQPPVAVCGACAHWRLMDSTFWHPPHGCCNLFPHGAFEDVRGCDATACWKFERDEPKPWKGDEA